MSVTTEGNGTSPSPAPEVPAPTPDQMSLWQNFFHALFPVLALVGVALPAAFTSDSAITMYAGGAVSIVALVTTGLSFWSHKVKNATLVKARAAAVWHREQAVRLRVNLTAATRSK